MSDWLLDGIDSSGRIGELAAVLEYEVYSIDKVLLILLERSLYFWESCTCTTYTHNWVG